MQTLEIIHNKTHVIRDQKMMLDFNLAELYEIETRVLKQSVRRNIERFPEDFMFILTKEEHANLRSQIVTSSYGGTRYTPFAFTEQCVAMLSSVLNSKKAIEVNIAIMRTFVVLRNSILYLEEISKRISEVEKKICFASSHFSGSCPDIYNALNSLMENNLQETEQKQRSPIGFQKK